MKTVTLREVAHSRAGEKGDDVTMSVVAWRPEDYDIVREQVSSAAVQRQFGTIVDGEVERFEVPSIGALNFILHNALRGGRSRTLAFEESGKALSSLVLMLPVEVPDDYVTRAEQVRSEQAAG